MRHSDFGNLHLDFARIPSLPLLAQAIDYAGDAILIIDADERVVWSNRAFTQLSGFQLEEIVGASSTVLHAQQKPGDSYRSLKGESVGQRIWRRELISKRRDGSTYITEEIVSPLFDHTGAITHFVAILHDVTKNKEALLQQQLLASQDSLTGLACRAHITELLETSIVDAQRSDQILAVLFVDLDGFKLINDNHGHHIGDAVLKAVAARLQGAVRCSDSVARFGGDEFVILLPTVSRRSVAKRIARHIVDNLSQPYAVGLACHDVSASVGISFYPQHGRTSETLLMRADEAMYRAKRSGGSQCRMAVLTAEPPRTPQLGEGDAGEDPCNSQPPSFPCRHEIHIDDCP